VMQIRFLSLLTQRRTSSWALTRTVLMLSNARSGTGSLTFTASVTDDSASKVVVVDDANIPVLAAITAGPNWAAGETLSVTGTSETISSANATMICTSLTDSDGQWEFTITSSYAISAKATYEVDVYMLDSNVWINGEDNETGPTNTATLNVDYATAGAGTLNAPSNVVAASNVSPTFTIEDAFGGAIAADALGRQYSVQLTSPDSDDIDLDVVATDGAATLVFDDYLTAGESDILTAKVYRRSATSPTLVSVDTAYSVTAALTDKWNNPLSGADLSFTAFAATTFNGVATAVEKTTDKNG